MELTEDEQVIAKKWLRIKEKPEVTDKPLHVRVAEALGCEVLLRFREWHCGCKPGKDLYYGAHAEHLIHQDCCHSHSGLACEPTLLARYDTDWSATGPLIEKYRIYLSPACPSKSDDGRGNTWDDFDWHAKQYRNQEAIVYAGSTPLLAACNLILALAEAGKLERVA